MPETTISAAGGAMPSRRAVAALAWTIYRQTWANPVKFTSADGRRRWSCAMAQAWFETKAAAARAAAPVVVKPARVAELEREDALLDYAESFPFIQARRAQIRAELSRLTGAAS